MTEIYHNGKLVSELYLNVTADRAFNYGDGLFETLCAHNGEIEFLSDHFERLNKGSKLLRLQLAPNLNSNTLNILYKSWANRHSYNGNARMKIIIWRNSGGFVAADTNETSWLLTITNYSGARRRQGNRLKLAKTTFVPITPYSGFKTLNCLAYVLGGEEKKEVGADDLVLLNINGEVVETLSSNIFWEKDGITYTPSLESGCLNGIYRLNHIKQLRNSGKEVREVRVKPELLSDSSLIYTTNSLVRVDYTGITN